VASQLLPLLERGDLQVGELAEMIQRDQALAARILRTANSAIYGGIVPVASVRDAVVRLGLAETSLVTLNAICAALFDLEDRAQRSVFPRLWTALWLDSLVCAYGARFLSKELAVGDPERVYLDATFRNVGALAVLRCVAKGRVRGRVRGNLTPDVLQAVIAELAPDLGARFLEGAKLPEHVVRCARLQSLVDLPTSAEYLDLHVVRLAGALSEWIGTSPFPRDGLSEAGRRCAEIFELDATKLAYFELQFRSLAEQARELT
jgi:HD-like signal output (HDOD) protein